jgi:FkbM family methyltransferase
VLDAQPIILKRLMMLPSGKECFAIGPYRIHFTPSYPIADRNSLLEGISCVIGETFLLPVLFCDEVNLNKGDVCLDLGANIGTTALLFSHCVGPAGQVIAVEPLTHDVIQANLTENGIHNVHVLPEGVSDAAGEAEMQVTDLCIDSSIVKPDPSRFNGGVSRKITLTTVDAIVDRLALSRLDFIKMDIEGAEEQAIRGATRTIQRFRPKWSVASYHTDSSNEKQHPKLVRLLNSLGYQTKEVGKSHIFAF